MKKLVLSALACATFIPGNALARVYSIDSMKIMQDSQEGKLLIAEIERERDNAIDRLKADEKEIKALQENITKQASLLKPEALRERQQELERKARSFERKQKEIGEDLNIRFQGKQEALFAKHMQAAQVAFEEKNKEGDGMLVDVRAPGVLAVGKNTSMTSEVLKKVDAEFVTSNVKAATKTA